jgi:predicted phage terminase large subunit-like protein
MLNQAVKHQVGNNLPVIGVEDGQIWKSISAVFDKRCHERRLYPSVELLKPLTDKAARARPLQGRMQQHMIVFPRDTEWTITAQQELLRFPSGVHDDIVDSLAWLAKLVVDKTPPARAQEKQIKSWKDRIFAGGAAASHMGA